MKYVLFFILLMIFWLGITYNLALPNIVLGLIITLLTMAIFGRHFNGDIKKYAQPQRYFWLVVYLFIFLWECLKANMDVAYRVVHPALPIKPGIVKIKLNVKSQVARTMLANSITMTPGTITVDIVDDYIYVHWIYISSTDPEVYGKKVAGRFEHYIKKIFE